FGEGNYFLELMSHGIREQERVNEGVREVSRRTGVPLVVTNDIHYVHADDAEAQDAMVCIQSGKTIDSPDRLKMIDNPELFMRTAAQMSELFPNDEEALQNTVRIAEKVDLKLPLGELRLPHFEVPAGKTPEEQLRTLAEAGLVEKYGAITPELRERVDKELAIIAKTGYTGYILIVQDFIRFAHEQGILTAGRGSRCGARSRHALRRGRPRREDDPLRHDAHRFAPHVRGAARPRAGGTCAAAPRPRGKGRGAGAVDRNPRRRRCHLAGAHHTARAPRALEGQRQRAADPVRGQAAREA